MEERVLGKTGLRVSPIGFGGAPLGLKDYLSEFDPQNAVQRETAIQAILRALELGITYFDTALGYGNGESERILGEARRRAGPAAEQMVIATKTPASQRTYEAVMQSAETSLANLGVDTIDVLQFHGSTWNDDHADSVLSGGGLDAFREMQRQGKVRFIGFTAETSSPGTFRMLRSGEFDVLQMAYNIMYSDACNLMVKSGPIVEAKERDMGVVTMRSLSSGVFQKLLATQAPDVDGYALALQFVLSNPRIDCPLVGMRTAEEVERNVRLAEDVAGRFNLEALHVRYV